jgi:enoyl-[acyl-carrier-protein] reductase (NADH)
MASPVHNANKWCGAVRSAAFARVVADAVAFLLSDKAQSISGTTLTVDAGATA